MNISYNANSMWIFIYLKHEILLKRNEKWYN